jgi:hypothetical protein
MEGLNEVESSRVSTREFVSPERDADQVPDPPPSEDVQVPDPCDGDAVIDAENGIVDELVHRV